MARAVQARAISFVSCQRPGVQHGNVMRIDSFIAAALLVGFPAVALGQTSFGLGGGASLPAAEFGRTNEIGYHLVGTLSVMPSLARAGFRVDAVFHEFRRAGTIQGIKERIIGGSVSAVVKLPAPSTAAPYVIAGLGMYNVSISPKPIAFTTSTDLAVNIGGGVTFRLASQSVFVEARYHRLIADGAPRFVPVTFGLTF
jgi:hypothetical protein